MQTHFSSAQLADPDYAASEEALRKCVHCGFCSAACPTYALLGDELDSPRGRIYQIQNMLEGGLAPTPQTVKHIDRCLSCLACVPACPSGVNYMHLIDHAREYIERKHRRPLADRMLRELLSSVFTRPWLFRFLLETARPFRWSARFLPGRLKGLMDLVPEQRPPEREWRSGREVFPAAGPRRVRVAMLHGCVQRSIAAEIDSAAIALLNRRGVEVVVHRDQSCCGALPHHMGKSERARELASRQIDAWSEELRGEGLDAIVTTTSGCGSTLKNYGFMFRDHPELAEKAATVARLSRDVTELVEEVGLGSMQLRGKKLAVAYHSACSLRYGQGVEKTPRALLAAAGFELREPAGREFCCGAAGTYNILQPELSRRLRGMVVAGMEGLGADVIASGNVGCMVQLAAGTATPVVHTVELLNWATGGAVPPAMAPRSDTVALGNEF